MTIKDIKRSIDLDSLEIYLINQHGEAVSGELKRYYVKDDVANLRWAIPPFAPEYPLTHAAIYTGKKLGTILKINTDEPYNIRSVIVQWSEQ